MSRTEADAIALAKHSLSQKPVPNGYIDIVRDFLKTNPYDDWWSMDLGTDPNNPDFGVVTCMEEGCWEDVILQPNLRVPDGGRRIGVGSMDEYRMHVTSHPTHVRERNKRNAARIAADRAKGVAVGVKREESPNVHANGLESPTKRARSTGSASGSGSATPMDGIQSLAPSQPAAGPSRLAAGGPSGGLSDEQKRKLLKDEYEYLRPMLIATRDQKIRKRIADRIKDVTKPLNRPGPVQEPPARTYDLLSHLPELAIKFGSFDHPPNNLAVARAAPAPAQVAIPVAPAPAPGPAPPQPQSMMDQLKSYYDRLAGVAGGAGVHAALAGPSNPLARGYNGMPGAFGSGVPGLGDDSDDEGLGYGGYRPRGAGNKVLQNGKQVTLKDFFDESLNDFADSTSVIDALKKLDLNDIKDILPGMKINLMPHQVIGVAWLMKQEETEKYCGGILADAMGLGKTVQTLALMVTNQSAEEKKKCNLIVAPIALLSQWKDEIESKSVNVDDPSEPALSVYIYHGAKKTKSRRELRGYDVILTSYGTLVAEFPKKPKKKPAKKKVNSEGEEESDGPAPKQVYGPLVKIEWFRIILDEGQQIRNKNTRVSQLLSELEADYRWVLTGTPITNHVDDLFGLFRFLQTPKYSDWDEFREHISKPAKRNADIAAKRAQAILKYTMLRRNKDSEIDGKPLLTLPAKEVVLEKLEFTHEERELYTQVETRARVRFNKFLKAGTVLKNYANVLTMLLRLRQLANHPFLLARAKGEAALPNDLLLGPEGEVVEDEPGAEVTKSSELKRVIALKGQEFVDQVKAKFKARRDAAALAERNNANAETDGDRECPICMEPLLESLITGCCMQEYCVTCVDELKPAENANADVDGDVDQKSCPTCRAKLNHDTLFKSIAFEDEPKEGSEEPAVKRESGSTIIPGAKIEDLDMKLEDDEDMPDQSMIGQGMGRKNKMAIHDSDDEDVKPDIKDLKGKGKAKVRANLSDTEDEEEDIKPKLKGKARFLGDDSDSDFEPDVKPDVKGKGKGRAVSLDDSDDDEPDDKKDADIHDIEPSSKLLRMLALIEQWKTESPDDKVIIFSQWVKFIDLIQVVLNREGHRFLRYEGSMTRIKREDTVRKFMNQEKCRILVISLKCGGVGLNLTRANRIINMDLAWNAATEDQALDRVHRIGQTKEVQVHRLVIDETVEQRILDLQEKKKRMADASLGEGSGQKMGRLSVRDLANLFGVNADAA